MSPPRILLVSRDPDFTGIYGRALQHAGHVVITARVPEDVVALAAAEQPDLVVVEFPTATADGARVTELLWADERTTRLRIIAITARVVGPELDEPLRCGATLVLPMPVPPTMVVGEVARLLEGT